MHGSRSATYILTCSSQTTGFVVKFEMRKFFYILCGLNREAAMVNWQWLLITCRHANIVLQHVHAYVVENKFACSTIKGDITIMRIYISTCTVPMIHTNSTHTRET